MLEDSKISAKHLVRFADWHREREPISRGRYRPRLDIVRRKVLVHKRDGVSTWLNVLFDLSRIITEKEESGRERD